MKSVFVGWWGFLDVQTVGREVGGEEIEESKWVGRSRILYNSHPDRE